MKLTKNISNLKFRMNLRKTLLVSNIEHVIITKEEATRELERRNKRKNK